MVFQLYSGISAGKFVEPGQFTACCVGYFASGLDHIFMSRSSSKALLQER